MFALTTAIAAADFIGTSLPVWMLVLLGSMTLAWLYIVARLRSRYDPLDQRFGSCIPPVDIPRITDGNSLARPDAGEQRFEE